MIVWPGNTLTPPSDDAVISNTILRVAVMEADPCTSITNVANQSGQITTKLVGYMPALIELLRSQMKFTPNIVLVFLNESYNEFIDGLLADLTITAVQREKVTFSNSIFDNSLRGSYGWRFCSLPCMEVFFICIFERSDHEMLQNRSICSVIALSIWGGP